MDTKDAWKTRKEGLYFVRTEDSSDDSRDKSAWYICRWDPDYAAETDGFGWAFSNYFCARDFKIRPAGEVWIICGEKVNVPDDGRKVVLNDGS